jgi:alkanesulfonate monooxygenase SsuD/methylene tetrahydromethanopterin reductase-like flavin-dependent oxidoreductase (luciferase family)
MFPTTRPLAELPDAARRLEALGFDELWVVEDCFAYGGPTAAATALASTAQLSVGVGLLPVSVRNVAIATMELATLSGLYPQRVRVAFGHGVEAWMRQIGARPANRITALEEVVTVTRALLRGERVTFAGEHVTLDDVELEQPPQSPPPLLIGTTGPRAIALAGRIADGLLLPEGAGDAAVRWATADLPRASHTTVYAWLRIDEDADAARRTLLPTIKGWRDQGMYPNLISRSGLTPDGDLESADADRVAVAGTPADCAQAVSRLHRAGASSIVLVPVGAEPAAQLEWFAADVLPLIGAGALPQETAR